MKRRKAQHTNQAIMRSVIAMALIVLLVCYLFLTMVSCTPAGPSFRVSGTISGAQDSTLLLEHMALDGVQLLDSTRLTADGTFAFTVPVAPIDSTSAPEFYRLRIAAQVINFAVDSIEDVTVQAAFPTMATAYDIQGNQASRVMKTVSLLNIQLQQQLRTVRDDASLPALQKADRTQQLVEAYKQQLKQDIILPDPASPAAYFALFQTIGSQMLFNPESNRSDVQFFAAVATQWDTRYPYAQRTLNLRNIALRGLRNTRPARPFQLQLDGEKIKETGIIDFGFPDISGQERRLSDLHDNVVLLDFTAYSLPASQQRNIELRELYSQYHRRGLEIMQVSLDADEHYWKTACEQLPWVCVRCDEGITSDIMQLYNVQQLPAIFIIGRGSEMKARGEQITDLKKAIELEL